MLSTLIYRSRARVQPAVQELQMIERGARERNARSAITGILIYDGVHFVQLLEGPEGAVEQTYARISGDRRHHCVVKLLHDYAPRRKFDGWGMRVFDVREWERPQIQALMADLLHDSRMPRADRAYKLLQGFAAGNWQGQVIAEDFDPHAWTLDRRGGVSRAATDFSGAECRFALQPIVNTTSGTISSLEALLRSAEGGPPSAVLDGLSAPEIYLLDLETKRQAIALAAEVGISDCKLSINLMPSSLTVVPNAVERLVAYAKEHGISTEQLIVEVTENEAISHFDDFAIALKKLRGAGIGVAIDDFGSGFAGLAMLAKFQPEKLKIDREIVSGIESDAARQAIARAIVQCCDDLGITVVAEGVESLHEWHWLKHAGIELFQGYLFARPMLEGVAAVDWPTPVALP